MRLRFFGGLAIEGRDGESLAVPGRGQRALLFRLALDAGAGVSGRALVEDLWPTEAPDDPRAALQSLISRLRRALPDGSIQAVPGGYRLNVARADVDVVAFQDLVRDARRAADAATAVTLAEAALALWTGDPWTPDDGFDWVLRDLVSDHGEATRLARSNAPAAPSLGAPAPQPAVPAPLTSLVGRVAELDLITAQLATERLVTVIGPGGAGKTTLALATARRRPGAIVVELAPASSGEVWSAVNGSIGRSMRPGDPALSQDDRDRALAAIAGRTVLIVLDNCEHVSMEAAAVAADLLGAAPQARMLATSREPLGLPGEAFVDLGPLPSADAVELFARRVRAARGSRPDDADSATVARIVRRLDGLPLALELAAAKTRTLSLDEIDTGLDDRFALLAAGPRAADPRHQTLRALIDWSWETLTEPERSALLAVAVFPDGIGTADAVTVAAEFGTDATAFDLLVDRSLMHRTDGRFRMLETVREYGLDRLRGAGGFRGVQARAAEVLAGLAARHDILLRGHQVREGLAWFDANDENLTAAARWTREDPELHDVGLRLLRGCLWAWAMRERFDEVTAGVEHFADADDPLDSEAAVVVNGLHLGLSGIFGDEPWDRVVPADLDAIDQRRRRIEQAAQRHPSELSLALPALLAAGLERVNGSVPEPSGIVPLRPAGPEDPALPPWSKAFLALMRAVYAQNTGDIDSLGHESERALAIFGTLGDVWGTALAGQMRSEWLMLRGRLDEALDVVLTGTDSMSGLISDWEQIQRRATAIGLLVRLGRLEEARERLSELRVLVAAEGSQRALVQCGFVEAEVELAVGDGPAALRALDVVPPEGNSERPHWAAMVQARRAQALVLCGRSDEARDAVRVALPLAVRSADQPILAEALLGLTAWLAMTSRTEAARQSFGLAVRLRGQADRTDPTFQRLARTLGEPEVAGAGELTALMALLD